MKDKKGGQIMQFNIRYGVTQTQNKAYKPVMFINEQTSSYYPNSRKTAKSALKLAEEWLNDKVKELEHFGNKVTVAKWEHSVI